MNGPIEITIDRSEIEKFAGLGKGVASAVFRGGSRALRTMRTASTRSIRMRKRIKLRVVNDSLVLTFPKTKELDSMLWRMDVKGTRMPVKEFQPRQTRAGVSVMINQGQRKVIPGAFIATMKSGHEGVYRRVGGVKRLPIRELYTTRVADLFADAGMIPAVVAQTLRAFNSEFDRVLAMELKK
ncbi:MAG: hypothetical protein QM723_40630 [Myxococcaceae bacterium]